MDDKMTLFDLHMHSEFSSDGEKTVDELLTLAGNFGLKHIAIADHNTMEAFKPALEIADNYGVKVIPAIELDCIYIDSVFYVFGYGIDPNHSGLKSLYEHIVKQELSAIPKKSN